MFAKRRSPIIFPHVPKCGGTSIFNYLKASGKRCFFDYDNPPSHVPFFQNNCDQRDADFRLLDFAPFDVVYGHFPLSRYTTTPDRIVLLLRDPVERAISTYYFFRDVVPANNAVTLSKDPTIQKIKSGEMDLLSYAREAQAASLYARYLQLPDTRNFALVGFTDDMPAFERHLAGLLKTPRAPLGRDRENAAKPEVSTEDRPALAALLADEIRWYEAQRKHWA